MICFLVRSLFVFMHFSLLFAGLEQHLKKAENKSNIHNMKNIDFIYMINLDQRPEKWERSCKQLKAYGIFPYRFSAVNGWELSLETINDVGLKFSPGMHVLKATTYPFSNKGQPIHEFTKLGKVYFSHCMSKGAIGIVLSHISVLKDAYDSGYETIWVMEDDIHAILDPREISNLIDKLDYLVGKDNWDVLFTDKETKLNNGKYVIARGTAPRPDMDCSIKARYCKEYTMDQQISPDFRRIGARFGAYSMIIRRSGIEKLLKFALEHKVFFPYDFDNYYPKNLKRYSLTYDLVGPLLGGVSDNKRCTYLKKD